jgi:hypothetical protein
MVREYILLSEWLKQNAGQYAKHDHLYDTECMDYLLLTSVLYALFATYITDICLDSAAFAT